MKKPKQAKRAKHRQAKRRQRRQYTVSLADGPNAWGEGLDTFEQWLAWEVARQMEKPD